MNVSFSWITSQNDTVPKLSQAYSRAARSWITSQNDTAPKQDDPDAELVEGVRPKELYGLWLQFKEIDDGADLSAAEKLAAKRGVLSVPGPPVVYKKPKDAFLLERGGAYDLAAHAALRAAGHEVVVREENAPEGFSNIDLVLDGRLCELKSPTTEASGTNGLRFIERNIRKAVKQFQKVEGGPVKPSIVVINCMEVPVARDDALKRVHLGYRVTISTG